MQSERSRVTAGWVSWALGLCVAFAGAGGARADTVPGDVSGTVATLDGKLYPGVIKFAAGAVTVTDGAGNVTNVAAGDVFQVTFRYATVAPAAGAAATGVAVANAPNLKSVDLGPTRPDSPGKATTPDGLNFRLQSGSGDITDTADSAQFVFQPISGDFDCVVRMQTLSSNDKAAKAGLMVRSSLDGGAPMAAVFIAHGGGVGFLRRHPGDATLHASNGAGNRTGFLRLSRQGTTVTSQFSNDGVAWMAVASDDLDLGDSVYVGMMVSNHDDQSGSLSYATFSNFAVSKLASTPAPAGGAAAPEAKVTLAAPVNVPGLVSGVVLKSGSILSADVKRGNDSMVHLSRGQTDIAIPTPRIARIILATVTAAASAHVPPGQSGALESNGDFVAGDLVDVAQDHAKISSPVLGAETLSKSAANQCVEVVLRDVDSDPSATPYEVVGQDGTDLMATSVTFQAGAISIVDDAAGTITMATKDVLQIRLGKGRGADLTESKPTKIDGKGAKPGDLPFAINTDLDGSPVSVDGLAVGHCIATYAGANLSYDVDPAAKGFSVRLAINGGGGGHFVVVGDGTELYHSQNLTSKDHSVSAYIPVSGVKTLTLRVESANAADTPTGIWVDPMIIK